MSDKYPPGTVIEVHVDGKAYPTYIDEHGVQRFYENGVVSKLCRESTAEFDRKNAVYAWSAARPAAAPGAVDLNEIARAYYRGVAAGDPPWTKRDYIEFNMMLGYSVCGLCDLNIMSDVEVINPVWVVNEEE